jgi:hypothetical protein
MDDSARDRGVLRVDGHNGAIREGKVGQMIARCRRYIRTMAGEIRMTWASIGSMIMMHP